VGLAQKIYPWKSIVDAIVTAVVLFAAGLVIYKNYPTQNPPPEIPLPSKPVPLDGAVLIGNSDAKLAILLYTDFLCPFCKSFAEDGLPFLRTKYIESGRALLAVRHLPIKQIHPFAPRAAEAAVCAHQQKRFMPLHDALFAHQKGLDEAKLLSLAASAGLDVPLFELCLSGSASKIVEADLESAEALKVSVTPSFLVGRLDEDGRLVVTKTITGAGLRPEEWQSVLDRAADESASIWNWVYGACLLVILAAVGMHLNNRRQRRTRPGTP